MKKSFSFLLLLALMVTSQSVCFSEDFPPGKSNVTTTENQLHADAVLQPNFELTILSAEPQAQVMCFATSYAFVSKETTCMPVADFGNRRLVLINKNIVIPKYQCFSFPIKTTSGWHSLLKS
jgi:hypothetical protein